MNSLAIGAAILAITAAIGTAGWFMLPLAEDPPSHTIAASPPPGPADSPIGPGDGFIADGDSISPFDDGHAAVGNLEPALRAAIQQATHDAALDGVELRLTSGWRSGRYQQSLFDEAIATYGSEREAQRWVNTPELSTHVTGEAVDVGPTDATSWLSQHGADYGLCQVYANEMWHFELLTGPGGVCPPQLDDATAGGPAAPRR